MLDPTGPRAERRDGMTRRRFLHASGLALGGLWLPPLAGAGKEAQIKPARFLFAWGKKGKGHGEFDSPIGIAINGADEILVTEFRNNRVQKFTAAGKYLQGTGGKGNGPGQFVTPHGLAVDSRGDLYVVDAQNQRVQKFAL